MTYAQRDYVYLALTGILFAGFSITYSQAEDMGFFLSMAASIADGRPIYSGFFEIKDPIFMWLAGFQYFVFGKPGPYILDALAVALGPIVAYLTATKFGASRLLGILSAIAFTAALAGNYYQSFRSGTLAIIFLMLALFFTISRRSFLSGIFVSLALGFKFAFAPMALAIFFILLLSEHRSKIRQAALFLLGASLMGVAILLALSLRGELAGYIQMMIQNFQYRNNYPDVVGQDGSISGHISNINLYGSNAVLLLLLPLLMFGVAAASRERHLIRSVGQLSLFSISTTVFLFLTVLWFHHLQSIALVTWASVLSAGLVSRMITSKENRVIVISSAAILGVSLLVSSGVSFALKPRIPLDQIVAPQWQTPPEVNALTDLRLDMETLNYARLGPNDDLGLAAFLPEGFTLGCRYYGQVGIETEQMISELEYCIRQKADLVFVSPGFFSLVRNAGNYEQTKDRMREVLLQNFSCYPVNDRPESQICIANKSQIKVNQPQT